MAHVRIACIGDPDVSHVRYIKPPGARMEKPDKLVLVVSDRAAVQTYFEHISTSNGGLGVTVHAVSVKEAAGCDALTRASAAVVDIFPNLPSALTTCLALRVARPRLSILAVVCCRDALTGWEEEHLSEHADAMIDLSISIEDARYTLRGLVRAGGVHLGWRRLSRPRRTPRAQVLSGEDADLVRGVARGLNNTQLGRILHLSRHGIDHRVKRLCLALGVRDRIELAAWGGLHGLYARGDGDLGASA